MAGFPALQHWFSQSWGVRTAGLTVLAFFQTLLNLFQFNYYKAKDSPYLQKNYAPIREEAFAQNLKVEGTLPAACNGVFMRVGPNPKYEPSGDYHWFDGDGMLHACRIKDGKVHFSNKWIRTNSLKHEDLVRFPVIQKMGDLKGLIGLLRIWLFNIFMALGFVNKKAGLGRANTALVQHSNKLMSLYESDLPYWIRVCCNGIIETITRTSFNGAWSHEFTAHPKVDSKTGEMIFIGYNCDKAPFVHYGVADKNGKVIRDVPIHKINAPTMMHDFAITEHYSLLFENSLVFDGAAMVKEMTLPFSFKTERKMRFGILKRHATSDKDMMMFEADRAMMLWHTANAWEEGDLIRLLVCGMSDFQLKLHENKQESSSRMWEFTFNLKTGKTTRRSVSDHTGCDFPQGDPSKMGYKSRFVYCTTLNYGETVGFPGLNKFDMSLPEGQQVVATIDHEGPHRFGGECQFVPSSQNPADLKGEDDGYLLTYVHDESTGISELVCYDAKTMNSKPVARVKLPQRVPYGFHSNFMNEQQFRNQLA